MIPIAQLPEAPSGFGLEDGSQGFFQRFSGPFGAGSSLARQDLGCHLGDALILLHELAFPHLPTNIRADEAAAPPLKSRRSPARATNAGRATTPAFAASCRASSSSLAYLLGEVQRHSNIVAHITNVTIPLLLLGATHPSVLFYPYRSRESKRRGSYDG